MKGLGARVRRSALNPKSSLNSNARCGVRTGRNACSIAAEDSLLDRDREAKRRRGSEEAVPADAGTLIQEGKKRSFLPGDRLTSPKAQKESTKRTGSVTMLVRVAVRSGRS